MNAHERTLMNEYCGDSALLIQVMREYQSMIIEIAIRSEVIAIRALAEII